MPLMQGKSPKAFKKNVEVEMDAGKPKKQSLAIAYNVQRKNAKKAAKGGHVHDEDCMAEGGMCRYAQGGTVTAKDEMHSTADNQERAPMRKASGSSPSLEMAHADSPDADDIADHESIASSIRAKQKKIMVMAEGGMIDADAEEDGEPAVPARKPDDMRLPEDEYMANSHNFASGGMADQHGGEDPEDDGSLPIHEAISKRRKRAEELHMMAEGGMVDLERNSEEDLNNEDQMSYRAGLKEQYDDSQISAQPEDSNEKGDDREEMSENEDDADLVSRIRRSMKSDSARGYRKS